MDQSLTFHRFCHLRSSGASFLAAPLPLPPLLFVHDPVHPAEKSDSVECLPSIASAGAMSEGVYIYRSEGIYICCNNLG